MFPDGRRSPLGAQLRKGALSTREALRIGVQLAEHLVKRHAAGQLQGIFSPDLIAIDDLTMEVHDIASGVGLGAAQPQYAAPEQTGRVGRRPDVRSDLYALGAILYELTTGRPLFAGRDHGALLHGLMTEIPASPEQSGVPSVLARLVMRLLAKDPDARYQSAVGVLEDLRRCFRGADKNAVLENFVLAQRDQRPIFALAANLHGRDADLTTVARCYGEARAGRTHLLCIRGAPGVGKTAVAQQLASQVQQDGSIFVAGKCSVAARNVPYDALAQVIANLVNRYCLSDESDLVALRARLSAGLGGDAFASATEIFPELAHLGLTSSVAPAVASGGDARVAHATIGIVRALLAHWRSPVVLVDDLQWADPESLITLVKLAEELSADGIMFVCTYRDDEVGPGLRAALDTLHALDGRVTTLALSCLDVPAIAALLAETFGCPAERTIALAELIAHKTGGNAFQVRGFLHLLNQENLVHYDTVSETWQWNLGRIGAVVAPDSSAAFWTQRLSAQTADSRRIFSAAACIGTDLDVRLLMALADRDGATVRRAVAIGLEEGIFTLRGSRVAFAHDQILEAAHRLIDDAEKDALHFNAARALLVEDLSGGRIFTVVNHINAAGPRALERFTPSQLLDINRTAAGRARLVGAYGAAVGYYQTIFELLPRCSALVQEPTWRWQLDMAECRGLAGDLDGAEGVFAALDGALSAPLERAEVQARRSLLLDAADESLRAIAAGLYGLRILGCRLPERPTIGHLAFSALRLRLARAGKSMDDLRRAPHIDDPHIVMRLEIISTLLRSSFFCAKDLWGLLCLEQATLAIRHGNSRFSSLSYSALAVYSSITRDVEFGYRMARLSHAMLSVYPDSPRHGFTYFGTATWAMHFHEGFDKIYPYLQEGQAIAVARGELDWANYCSFAMLSLQLFADAHLSDVLAQADRHLAHTAKGVGRFGVVAAIPLRQLVLALQGRTQALSSLSSTHMTEADALAVCDGMPDSLLTFFHVMKVIACYMAEDFAEAVDHGAPVYQRCVDGLPGNFIVSQYCLYVGLAILGKWGRVPGGSRRSERRLLAKCRAQLKWWGSHPAENFLGDWLLLEGELARHKKQLPRALALFNQAAQILESKKFIGKQALAAELSARALADCGETIGAQTQFLRAMDCYERWGAAAKAAQLRSKMGLQSDPALGLESSPTTLALAHVELDELLAAARAISAEMAMGKLLPVLARHLAHLAGAERAVILTSTAGHLAVRADTLAAEPSESATESDLAVGRGLPLKLLQYVQRTRQTIRLENAAQDTIFGVDVYIQTEQIKSVLCLPMMSHGAMEGIVYLENNQIAHAFTDLKQEMVALLASQGAVALQNAAAYGDLEERMVQRTAALLDAQRRLDALGKAALEMQMAGGFAHEMHNVLCAAKIFRDVAQTSLAPRDATETIPAEPKAKVAQIASTVTDLDEALAGINRCIDRGLGVIDSVLEYARAGRDAGPPGMVQVASVVAACVADVQKELDAAGIRIRTNIPMDACLRVNEMHLSSIIRHLLSNASDALRARQSTVGRCIEIALGAEENHAVLQVKDNGIGMSADEQARICEPFFGTKGSPSSGLGLAIVQKIAASYGGTIRCATAPDVGTTMTITFRV